MNHNRHYYCFVVICLLWNIADNYHSEVKCHFFTHYFLWNPLVWQNTVKSYYSADIKIMTFWNVLKKYNFFNFVTPPKKVLDFFITSLQTAIAQRSINWEGSTKTVGHSGHEYDHLRARVGQTESTWRPWWRVGLCG